MEKEYIGYIKETRSGKFRAALGTLHDVGEPDGDKTVMEVAASDMFDTLSEVTTELKEQCKSSGVEKVCFVPIRKGQILWESELTPS
jgi:hypothetical protein